jgi:uncharacterized protein YjaG (DUF416 family)
MKNIDETLSNLHDIINSADDYDVTNINGLVNVAIDNPELFKTLVAIINAESETMYDLSAYCQERIEDLGL